MSRRVVMKILVIVKSQGLTIQVKDKPFIPGVYWKYGRQSTNSCFAVVNRSTLCSHIPRNPGGSGSSTRKTSWKS